MRLATASAGPLAGALLLLVMLAASAHVVLGAQVHLRLQPASELFSVMYAGTAGPTPSFSIAAVDPATDRISTVRTTAVIGTKLGDYRAEVEMVNGVVTVGDALLTQCTSDDRPNQFYVALPSLGVVWWSHRFPVRASPLSTKRIAFLTTSRLHEHGLTAVTPGAQPADFVRVGLVDACGKVTSELSLADVTLSFVDASDNVLEAAVVVNNAIVVPASLASQCSVRLSVSESVTEFGSSVESGPIVVGTDASFSAFGVRETPATVTQGSAFALTLDVHGKAVDAAQITATSNAKALHPGTVDASSPGQLQINFDAADGCLPTVGTRVFVSGANDVVPVTIPLVVRPGAASYVALLVDGTTVTDNVVSVAAGEALPFLALEVRDSCHTVVASFNATATLASSSSALRNLSPTTSFSYGFADLSGLYLDLSAAGDATVTATTSGLPDFTFTVRASATTTRLRFAPWVDSSLSVTPPLLKIGGSSFVSIEGRRGDHAMLAGQATVTGGFELMHPTNPTKVSMAEYGVQSTSGSFDMPVGLGRCPPAAMARLTFGSTDATADVVTEPLNLQAAFSNPAERLSLLAPRDVTALSGSTVFVAGVINSCGEVVSTRRDPITVSVNVNGDSRMIRSVSAQHGYAVFCPSGATPTTSNAEQVVVTASAESLESSLISHATPAPPQPNAPPIVTVAADPPKGPAGTDDATATTASPSASFAPASIGLGVMAVVVFCGTAF